MSLRTDELKGFFKRLIGNSDDAIKEAFGEVAAHIVEDMREVGKPITYPVQWDSEKQRKAFFATDGFGGGIPHVRKGDYVNSWKKTELPNGWEISAQHPAGAIGGTLNGKSSLFAQGGQSFSTWQSKIHRGRWRMFLTTATQRISEMPKRMMSKLKTAVKSSE